ncbi:CPBP family intramembrane metalloprotease, partial [Candidatus Woesebacteria bacterium]|nr:CPBP family intramembrane metalloprotease [Candidatus Woesebacteria bacterium]
MRMKHSINWKMFFILLSASLMSVLCVFPYVLTLQGDVLNKLGISIGFLILAQFTQSIVLFSILIFFGLLLTKKVHFQLPLLESILATGNYHKVLKSILVKSIISGIIVAAIIYGLDTLFTILGTAVTTHQINAPIWQTLLASFYGGITEEIIMRLFLMTLF